MLIERRQYRGFTLHAECVPLPDAPSGPGTVAALVWVIPPADVEGASPVAYSVQDPCRTFSSSVAALQAACRKGEDEVDRAMACRSKNVDRHSASTHALVSALS